MGNCVLRTGSVSLTLDLKLYRSLYLAVYLTLYLAVYIALYLALYIALYLASRSLSLFCLLPGQGCAFHKRFLAATKRHFGLPLC